MMNALPVVGNIVYFYRYANGKHEGPFAAIVTDVSDVLRINLAVFGSGGTTYPRISVLLRQPGEERPDTDYCCFMPQRFRCEPVDDNAEDLRTAKETERQAAQGESKCTGDMTRRPIEESQGENARLKRWLKEAVALLKAAVTLLKEPPFDGCEM